MTRFTRSGVRKHHGARDGAIIGAIGGHENHKGHTGRDALVGGIGGHVVESHREKKGARKMRRSRAPVGTTAAGGSSVAAHRAPLSDRIAGKAKVAMGKLTRNRGLVTRGEIEQTYGKGGVAAAGLGPTGAGTSRGAVVY